MVEPFCAERCPTLHIATELPITSPAMAKTQALMHFCASRGDPNDSLETLFRVCMEGCLGKLAFDVIFSNVPVPMYEKSLQ